MANLDTHLCQLCIEAPDIQFLNNHIQKTQLCSYIYHRSGKGWRKSCIHRYLFGSLGQSIPHHRGTGRRPLQGSTVDINRISCKLDNNILSLLTHLSMLTRIWHTRDLTVAVCPFTKDALKRYKGACSFNWV